MEISKELLKKAETAKTAEELKELAKAEGVELTAEDAEKAFARLHKSGELADEELDNVSGGWCVNPSPEGVEYSRKDVKHLYHVGQTIEYIYGGTETRRSVIEATGIEEWWGKFFPTYDVREVENKKLHKEVRQDEIQIP